MITRRLLRPAGQIASSPWTCLACRGRTSLLQTLPKYTQSRHASTTPQATTHDIPKLHHDDFFREKGVGGLFSDDGYRVAWTEYQGMILNKLRELVSGTPDEYSKPKDLAMRYARDPMNASLFNHASAAFNNHFFFQTLSTHPVQLADEIALENSLIKTFGSVETLRATMVDTAAAMFGPGYVWLVWARNPDSSGRGTGTPPGSWRILTTYLAGTPFPEAGYRQQGVDMNNQNPNSYNSYLAQQSQIPNNSVGSFGAYSSVGKQQANIPPGGISLMPVLCVSTWEHTYLRDYDVDGKRRYLSNWWLAIDWKAVSDLAPTEATSLGSFTSTPR